MLRWMAALRKPHRTAPGCRASCRSGTARRSVLLLAGFCPFVLGIVLAVLAIATDGSAKPGQPTITTLKPIVVDVRVGRHPDKTRFVIEVTDILDYTLLPLADPYRLVIDFPLLDWQSGEQQGEGIDLIARHRSARFDQTTTRLVLDLNGPARIKDHFFLPAKDGHLPRFVLDLAPTTAARFAAIAGKQIGSSGHTAPDESGKTATASDAVAPPHGGDGSSVGGPPEAPVSALRATPGVSPRIAEPPPLVPPRRPDRWVVVIDPGHGGIDPGAIGVGGVAEKTITLAMARDLRTVMHRTGRFKVILTRTDDRILRLRERVEVARRAGADLFLSLHADSIGLKNFRGVSVYTLSETASDREAEMLAAKENRADALAGIDLSHEQDEVVSILIDLAQRDALNQARRFAQLVVDRFSGVAPLIPRPHRSAGFAVLTAPDVPSVLIELGYLTNQQDAVLLQQRSYRRKLAAALTQSILQFFETLATAQRL